MATKVGILDSHQHVSAKPAESRKRSYAELLVRRLLADQIGKYLYQRRAVKPSMELLKYTPICSASGRRAEPNEPSCSPRMGRLRWEPPKNKRQLKAHPWQNMNPIADQRSFPAY